MRHRKPRIESLEARRLLSSALLQDIVPGSSTSAPFGMTTVGQQVFFFANSAINANSTGLYKTSGTAASTVRIASAHPSQYAPDRDASSSLFFYAGTDANNRNQLFRSDGTAAGTFAVTDGGAINFDITWTNYTRVKVAAAGKAVFVASRGGNNQLYITDGTVAGTSLLKDLFPGEYYQPDDFQVAGNEVFFKVSDPETAYEQLWKTDGTSNGTQMVMDFGVDLSLSSLVASGPTLYFSVQGNGEDWWRSDGTAQGTYSLTDTHSGSLSYASVGNQLYFDSYDDATYGYRLWKSDGTVAGTGPVDPAPAEHASFIDDITPWQGGVLFCEQTDISGVALWKYQSNMALPQPIAPITHASTIISASDRAYFQETDAAHGLELWVTDGTAAGTHLLADDVPGPTGSSPLSNGGAILGRALVYGGFASGIGHEPRIAPVTEISSVAFQYNRPRQQIVIDFADPIDPATFTASDLSLTSTGASPQTIPAAQLNVSFNAANTEAIVTYTGSASGALPDGNWHLADAAVSFANTAGVFNFQANSFDFFTLAGDANHDGVVNVADLSIAAQNYLGTSRLFNQGDFNYDTKVDLDDLKILAANWNRTPGGASLGPALAMPSLIPLSPPPPPVAILSTATKRTAPKLITLVQ